MLHEKSAEAVRVAGGRILRDELRRSSRMVSCGLVILGVLVLVGWGLNVPVLKSVIPGYVPMNPLTALSFVVCGIVLLLSQEVHVSTSPPPPLPRSSPEEERRRPGGKTPVEALTLPTPPMRETEAGDRLAGAPESIFSVDRVSAALSCSVGLVGALIALRYVFPWAIPPLDELVFPDRLGGNRMAPNTAICLVLSGISLALLRGRSRVAQAGMQSAAVLGLVLGLLALTGYSFGVRTLYRLQQFTPMALNTTLGFLALFYGILASRPALGVFAEITSRHSGGLVARALIPFSIVVPLTLGGLHIYALRGVLFDVESASAIFVSAVIVTMVCMVWWLARMLNRLDRRHERSEQEARAGEERLRLAVLSGNLGTYDLDLVRSEFTFDARFAEQHGIEGSARKMSLAEGFLLLAPEDRQSVAVSMQEGLASGESYRMQYRIPLAGGGFRWIEGYGYPVLDPDGRALRSFGVSRDVTDRMGAEERLADALKEAELSREVATSANRAKSEFLSRMSHELRTPLNSILGFAQLLELDPLSGEQRESLAYIQRGGRHLLGLLNDVLDISRIESGKIALSLEPVEFLQAAREVASLLAPMAEKYRIALHLPSRSTFVYHVLADQQRLKQVLMNLLSNAIKYNRPGGSVSLRVEEAPGSRLRFSVKDTGPGISAEHLARLFLPFDRLGAERTTIEGTGLGLALSKSLVEAMGMKIDVESQPGQGSTFVLDMLLVPPPAPPTLRRAEATPEPITNVDGYIILCIEDNPTNLRLIERVLQQRPSIRLVSAVQGGLGLELAAEHRPHLILLDLNLPDMHGHEVLARLHADPRTRAIPVVVLSADATPGMVERTLAAGAIEYLAKPFDVQRFLKVLDRTLNPDGAPQTPETPPAPSTTPPVSPPPTPLPLPATARASATAPAPAEARPPHSP